MAVTSDFTLLQGAKRGQDGPYQELCRRHREELATFAGNLLKGHGGTTSGDDVVISVYAELWDVFKEDKERTALVGDFTTFCKTMIREAVSDLRAARGEPPSECEEEADPEPPEEPPRPEQPSPAASGPEDDLGAKLALLEGSGASSLHLQAFRLRREGMSVDRIGEVVGRNVTTLRRCLEDTVRFFEAVRTGTEPPPWPNRDRRRRSPVPEPLGSGVVFPAKAAKPTSSKPNAVDALAAIEKAREELRERHEALRDEMAREYERRRVLLDSEFFGILDKLLQRGEEL